MVILLTNSLTVFGDVTIVVVNLDMVTVSASAGSFTNITASSDLTINGNSTLGNAGTDTVTINGVVATDIIASGNKTKDLGSSNAR